MHRLFIAILFFLISIVGYSQFKISDAEVLIKSRHVWRGTQLGSIFAVEPSLTLSNNRFSFNVWAAITPDNSYSEVDLVPSYQFNHFKLSLFDYYNPVQAAPNQYLNFNEGESRHSLELSLDNFSVENRKLKWMIGTFLAGDRNKITGKAMYSTYFEFRYPFAIWMIDAEPFVGITPFQAYYANSFAVINAGISFSKELNLNLPFKVPLSLSYISNPYTSKNFLIFSLGVKI